MIIKSIEVGDRFVHENGTTVLVKKISCGFDEQEKRWETSIKYDTIHPRLPTLSNEDVITKARDFVIMIQETDSGFVTHVHAPESNASPIEEISFTPGSGSAYNSNRVATPPTAPGKSQIELDFINSASGYGLQPSDLGRTVNIVRNGKRKRYVIVGAKPRNWKYPILMKNSRGTTYKFPVKRVLENLK